jgi:cell division protein FtsI/penicillin-binding protein 2
LTFRQVLARSSNVGIIKAGRRLGRERFYDMVRSFGFGRPTGIDLPGESAGILRPRERFTDLATAYGSFGMGLGVTAVQLGHAFAAVARGGELRRPYVVASTSRRGPVALAGDARSEVALSLRAAVTLTELLEAAVRDGTGEAAAIPGYRVAGKTGTAEKSDRNGYSQTGRVASFVGFAPVSEPRIVGLFVLDEPRVSIHGGEVAAPSFSRLVGEALLYLGVPPDDRSSPAGQIAGRRLWRATLGVGERLELSEKREAADALPGASSDATL